MPAQPPSNIEVIITVQDAERGQLQAIASQLEAAGLHLDAVLSEIGIVTGTVRPDALAQLRRVEGVLAIEPSGSVQL